MNAQEYIYREMYQSIIKSSGIHYPAAVGLATVGWYLSSCLGALWGAPRKLVGTQVLSRSTYDNSNKGQSLPEKMVSVSARSPRDPWWDVCTFSAKAA